MLSGRWQHLEPGLRVRWCLWLDDRHVLRFVFCARQRWQAANWQRATGKLGTGNRLIYEQLLPCPVIRNRASNVQLKLQLKLQLHKSKSNSFAGDFARGHVASLLSPQATWLCSSQVISQANEDIASSSLLLWLKCSAGTCQPVAEAQGEAALGRGVLFLGAKMKRLAICQPAKRCKVAPIKRSDSRHW